MNLEGNAVRIDTAGRPAVVVRPLAVPISDQLRLAAARISETSSPVTAVAVEGSRLRVEQLRVFGEFGRFLNDLAMNTSADSAAVFGRIIQPPRTGKTVVAAHILARTRLPSVFVVPTRTLVGQTVREMAVHAPSVPVGAFYGERKALVEDGLNVTTYSMLVAAWEAGKLPAPIRRAALIFADEGHRAMTPRRLNALRDAFDPRALRVALTATPNYDDPARRLELHFPSLIHEIMLDEALALGLLAPLRVWVAEVDADASTIQLVAGDFEGQALGRLMSAAPFFRAVELFRYDGSNAQRPCLVTCASRQQAHDLVQFLSASRAHGEPRQRRMVRLVLGETSAREREEILADFEAGRADTIVQVGVLVEGWSSPRCKLLIDLAPSISLVRATQKFFRVMTPHQEKEARIYMLLPAGLPALPILPTEIFAGPQADDYECGALIGATEDESSGFRAALDGTRGTPIAGVVVRQRVLLSARFEKPILDRGAWDDIRAVLATCPTWKPGSPASLARFRWLFFHHAIFLGRGDFLLRWLGVPRTTRAYASLLARLYPQAAASVILGATDDPDLGCDNDRHYLTTVLLSGLGESDPGQADFASAWRAVTGTPSADWPDAHLLARERASDVMRLLSNLTRSKQKVIAAHFGLQGGAASTIAELAEAERVSRGRVGQIIKAALRRLSRGAAIDDAGNIHWRMHSRPRRPAL